MFTEGKACICAIPYWREKGQRGGLETLEGTMFCASGCCPDEGENCQETEATPARWEALQAWYIQRLERRKAWIRHDLEVRKRRQYWKYVERLREP